MTNKIAIMYDFDSTLAPGNMQEYSLIPALGYSTEQFWNLVSDCTKSNKMDALLSALYVITTVAKEKNLPLTREKMHEFGKDISFFPGVETYFERINQYGRQKGVQIEHFLISSGNKELVEGCKIYPYFTKLFASEYHYGSDGIADWPAVSVNYTNKTQFLYRINKNALDITDNTSINAHLSKKQRDIPFTQMIYIGDGYTDVPCMQVVKDNGGFSVAVYTEKSIKVADDLVNDGRVNFAAEADYSEGSRLDTIIKAIIDKMQSDIVLNNMEF